MGRGRKRGAPPDSSEDEGHEGPNEGDAAASGPEQLHTDDVAATDFVEPASWFQVHISVIQVCQSQRSKGHVF